MKISVLLHNAPKKGEDQNLRQVIFRVRESNNDLKVRTDLMAGLRSFAHTKLRQDY